MGPKACVMEVGALKRRTNGCRKRETEKHILLLGSAATKTNEKEMLKASMASDKTQ